MGAGQKSSNYGRQGSASRQKSGRDDEICRCYVVPTILDLLKMPTKKMDFEGVSLMPVITKRGLEESSAYAECLYDFGSREHEEL